MTRFFRPFVALLAALSIAFPALATPLPTSIANTVTATAGVASPYYVPTTVAAPASQPRFIFVSLYSPLTLTGLAVADSCGDTDTAITASVSVISNIARAAPYYDNGATCHLPAPCTVTATMAVANTLVISATSTCPSNATFTTGQLPTGGSITAQTIFSGSCTLVSGAATCTLSGDSATFSSPTTITISSSFKISWTDATTRPLAFVADTISGMGTSVPNPSAGTANSCSSSCSGSTVNSPTLSTPLGIVFGATLMNCATGNTFTQTGSFSLLQSANCSTNSRPNAYVSYIIPPSTTAVTDSGTFTSPGTQNWWANTYPWNLGTVGPIITAPPCTMQIMGVGVC